MKLDRTTILAIVLCVLAYIGYEYYLNQRYPDRFHKKPKPEALVSHVSQELSSPRPQESAQSLFPAQTSEAAKLSYTYLDADQLRIENDTSIFTFDQSLGAIASIVLKEFENEEHTGKMDVLAHPLKIHPMLTTTARDSLGFQAKREGRSLTFSRQEGPWLLSHRVTMDEAGYGASLDFSWKNVGQVPEELRSVIMMKNTLPTPKEGGGFLPGMPTGRPSLVVAHTGDIERFDAIDLCKKSEQGTIVHTGQNYNLGVIGFDQHYFLTVLLPQSKRASYSILKNSGGEGQTCSFSIFTDNEQGAVKPGEEIVVSYKAWFGPKSTHFFASYDEALPKTLDLGFFGKIANPLLAALRFLHDLVSNWGLAIIIMTLFLKILFFPLTRQAAISMHKMKKLQPEMNKIREKYKGDNQKIQQETMRFMTTHKVNPMKGCLPILPQIPVFFAFYRVLSTSIELRHAPFYGWIIDLSSSDPYYITPILLGVSMFAQQKLTPTTGLDKTQERIMTMVPLIFAVMMLTLPAGMVLYMLTNTVVSIAQQQWLNRRLS
ncbi:MAG: membrane protein insertase YidC [Deltaproteobacteria bacterium]|nr:membrane protein insertase YidC [Deltaproteobacteria bacterium]